MMRILVKTGIFVLIGLGTINTSMAMVAEKSIPLKFHPLFLSTGLPTLYGVACTVLRELDRCFFGRKQIVISLGQTPAYLIKMIEFLDPRPERREYKYLAFSGKFMDIVQDRPHLQYYFVPNGLYDTDVESKERFYWEYLERMHLCPVAMSHTASDYIFIDWIDSGRGAASFMHLMRNHPPSRMRFLYLALTSARTFSLGKFSSQRIDLDKNEDELLRCIGLCDVYDDRLVAHFPCTQWRTVDPMQYMVSRNAQHLVEKCRKFAYVMATGGAGAPTDPLAVQRDTCILLLRLDIKDGRFGLLLKIMQKSPLSIDLQELIEYAKSCGQHGAVWFLQMMFRPDLGSRASN